MNDAVLASTKAKQVYLLLSSSWKSSSSLAERIARKTASISWMNINSIASVHSMKDKVLIDYSLRGSRMVQEASWAIIATDWTPDSALAEPLVRCDFAGSIVTYDTSGITSGRGVFSCGEVASRTPLSAIAAAADGLSTSQSVCQYLLDLGIVPSPPPPPKVEKKLPKKPPENKSPEEQQE
jgi:thioredoxin reductase